MDVAADTDDVASPADDDAPAAGGGRRRRSRAGETAVEERPLPTPVHLHEEIVGRATARYIRMSPTKVRRVVDLVRGLPATDAQAIVRFDGHAAAEPVGKVLDSAVANAAHLSHVRNQRLDTEELLVIEAYVDEGPTMKRFRPRAQGRAARIRKRTSHITIAVAPAQSEAAMYGVNRRAR